MPKPQLKTTYELAYVSLCTSFAVLDMATKIFAKDQVKLVTCLGPIEGFIQEAVSVDCVTSESVTNLVNSWDEYKEKTSFDWDEVEPLHPAMHAFEESLFVYMALAIEPFEQSNNSPE